MLKLISRTLVSPQLVEEAKFPVKSEKVQISEMPLGGILRIQGNTVDPAFKVAVAAALDLELPEPEAMVAKGDLRLAWAGPKEYLCFCSIEDEARYEQSLRSSLMGQFATTTLMSDSRIAFVISGQSAAAFLSKGCSVDMDPACFGVGRVVTTRFAGLPAMIMCRDKNEYAAYFEVGYAQFLVRWIVDAAAEFSE
jgi:sarcosine oxidase subunit gamma